ACGVVEYLALRQQSGAMIGVLVAITGHGPTPSEGGSSRHRKGGNSTPHPPEEARTRLLKWRLLIRVLVVPLAGEDTFGKLGRRGK
ncbi:hypothetical protein AVEN_98055-1, partial [Araneus ventricosus]